MGTKPNTFVGFGFGAIQAGLFLHEAFRSGNFQRLVVAEVVPEMVEAIRRADGCYQLNVATQQGIEAHEVRGLEILNPTVPADASVLVDALSQASEIATALPSVQFYDHGSASVAQLLATALRKKAEEESLPRCIIYAAENHNHAAETLESLCRKKLGETFSPGSALPGQFLNTVIGKMSGVINDPAEIASARLTCLTGDLPRAFLVEEFNRILISRISIPNFQRGISVFEEKLDLLPFEEAKLYGHNAVHALLGFLAARKGYVFMSDAVKDTGLLEFAREAFLEESRPALLSRYEGLDALFTKAGYAAYAKDLLRRMTNPFLRDQIARITRDIPRKLGWDDRLIGTMRLALDAGVTPWRFALGATAALEAAALSVPSSQFLEKLWPEADLPEGRKKQIIALITEAQTKLKSGKLNHGYF